MIIHGLFIDAGRWDPKLHKLVDPNPGKTFNFIQIWYPILTTHTHKQRFRNMKLKHHIGLKYMRRCPFEIQKSR